MNDLGAELLNEVRWHLTKLLQIVRLGILDYGRVAKASVCKSRKNRSPTSIALTQRFVVRWCCHGAFASMVEGKAVMGIVRSYGGLYFPTPLSEF